MAYTKTVWSSGDTITATLANNWETQYDSIKDGDEQMDFSLQVDGLATVLRLINTEPHASGSTNEAVAQYFLLTTADNAGAIKVGKEADFTTAANKDSYMAFFVVENGSLAERARITSAGVFEIGGNTAWHAGNDGSGSGLDADLVDGVEPATANTASAIVKRDANKMAMHTVPACKARMTADQTISSYSNTILNFAAEDFDNDSMHVTSAPDNTKITINTAGIYHVVATVYWDYNTSGSRIVSLKKNGSYLYDQVTGINGSDSQVLSTYLSLAVNDYIEVRVYQDSGSDVIVSYQETQFSAVLVSAA